jgi:hypothetical protein
MNTRFALSSAVAALALVSFAAAGAGMAPGLWEHNLKFKSQSGEMEKGMADMQAKMASLPPDQRRSLEQMMAKKGMSFQAQGTTLRICVSKEQAERMEPLPMNKAECKQDVVSRTASSMKIRWACGGNDPSSGEGEIHFSSDKAFTGRAIVNSVRQGKPDRVDVESIGTWLSADCGGVKPRTGGRP